MKSGLKQRTIPNDIPELHQDDLVEIVIAETISEADDFVVVVVC